MSKWVILKKSSADCILVTSGRAQCGLRAADAIAAMILHDAVVDVAKDAAVVDGAAVADGAVRAASAVVNAVDGAAVFEEKVGSFLEWVQEIKGSPLYTAEIWAGRGSFISIRISETNRQEGQ
ncbi:hypothetical protein ACI7RC_10950 [Brevibacillus sp. B_LB10_24]|uniref:hypothetical protein n=1 Tax=Brevibacillus sp. B_LB10_24 TaxID=3380645 RepID=UPI0038BB8463